MKHRIQTETVLVQNLCVPCGCRCRYCLLSWDGETVGTDWNRGLALARSLRDWLRENRPALQFAAAFGYAMEHPDLEQALRDLRELGSPQTEYLQCDGMRLRSPEECRALAELLARAGVRHLNFTVYGLPEYHDRFAARAGDYAGILRLMEAARAVGLIVSCGIPLTLESAPQLPALRERLRREAGVEQVFLFVPHEEGRGGSLARVRVTEEAVAGLPEDLQGLLNRQLFRSERAWLTEKAFRPETRRMLLLSLRRDNIEAYERMTPEQLLTHLEALDEAYYAAFPTLPELAERYGDPENTRLYRQRDLFASYRRRYAAEFGVSVYDVTDERQSGSRRY